MDLTILVVFCLVYMGMILGRFPGLAIDRTGVALLGAIALIATGRLTPEAAWNANDVPTITLLLSLMVVSAQFRLGGFYSVVAQRLSTAQVSPSVLLLLLIGVSALLSAVLANDIVCLAFTPLLIEGCVRRGLKPVPFLLALACASNVGSAATLIGNPQNMLIGQKLNLSFSGYLLDGVLPAALGCVAIWLLICWLVHGQWRQRPGTIDIPAPHFDLWQTAKGSVVLAGLMAAFLFAPWPREVVALAAAGLLLMSRYLHTRRMLAQVDWQLLVLFAGLFVVNHALAASGMLAQGMERLHAAGVAVEQPVWLFGTTVVLSNLVSNVPAVMLLLPAATHPQAGAILALASTLAGNLFIVGSIANIIVIDQAERLGIRITWREHARVGVPVTLATLAIAGAWLYFRAGAQC